MAEGPLGRGEKVVVRVLLQGVRRLRSLQLTKGRLGCLQDTLRLRVLVSKQGLVGGEKEQAAPGE